MFKHIGTYLLLLSFITACMPVAKRDITNSISDSQQMANPAGGTLGQGSITQDDPMDTSSDTTTVVTRVELRHFVDPFTETFKPKITIPKNFSGILYLAGLNMASLKDKYIFVKFSFGREYETVTVPAVVGQAVEGITPRTNVEVLILHMENKPFSKIRLPYNLFDYNDYSNGEDPVTDPRDVGLYCRGLNLYDDNTFSGGTECSASDQTCKYAYAKILDRGLLTNEDPSNLGYPLANGATYMLTPTTQQIALNSDGTFDKESFTDLQKKCLPDNNSLDAIKALFTDNDIPVGTTTMSPGVLVKQNGALTYTYNGPYQSINLSNWQIENDAIFGTYGIFKSSFASPSTPEQGYKSLLFPLAGKLPLRSGVHYLGSSDPWAEKEDKVLSAAGDSEWMDGCNIRVSKYDPDTNEGISSCNVTARVEVVVKDPDSGVEETRVISKDVKLQLIRESETDSVGREFLYSAMKTCDTNNACGAQECCYNNRCWSKDLISACLDDSTGHGDLGIGEACTSDYQCQSLCCNVSTGVCAVHDPTQDPPVYCSKAPGQSCVAKEWCQKQNVTKYFIVKTGTTPTGEVLCALRTYSVQVFPSCTDGKCVPPPSESPPPFDYANPDCSNAKTPEEIEQILMEL